MRRMIAPEMIIKSQVVDDKEMVDLNEILEKYGTEFGDVGDKIKTITLQIYNKLIDDEDQNTLSDDNGAIGSVVVNGSITISKNSDGDVFIQGMLHNEGVFIIYLEIPSGSYENGISLVGTNDFDLYVIRV